MLSDFCKSWNTLYKDHNADYHVGSVTIKEKSQSARNKSLTVNCIEAVSFPSKQFEGYDLFGSLTKRNCDGVFLILNDEGSYDLIYVEMKSRFSSQEAFEAKCQIVETCAKMQSLLQMLKPYYLLTIRNIFGIIEMRELDEDQTNLWLKLQMLPDEKLDFGWSLIKYGMVKGQTHCNPELNMPETMKFRIIFSDADNYTVSYSDLCK